ncbi:MAG: hypothetical protein M3Q81_02000 [bacterium]|nr:hypothetical protein [bacterium]
MQLKKMTPLKNKLIVAMGVFTAAALLHSAHQTALAERLESDSYVIQFGNFNVTSGQKSSASYTVTDTVGQTGAGPFGQYGSSSYFVGAGFQYIYQIDTFSFRLSRTAVDLGVVTPDSHNSGSHTMSITTRGAGGYAVSAYEIHPLRTVGGGNVIADTTCDAGTCDETSAAIWSNQSIPGFGFNMTGNDIPTDFTSSNYFRQFADASLVEPMQIVMSSSSINTERTATVTYKVGAPGSQAAGAYQTGVVYVAVPGY